MRIVLVALALVALLVLPAMAEQSSPSRTTPVSIPSISTATRDKEAGDDHGEEAYESAAESNTEAARANGPRSNINRKSHD